MRGGGELAGVGERAVAVAQQHRDVVVDVRWRRPGRGWPSPLKSPATMAIGLDPDRVSDLRAGTCRRRCPAAPTPCPTSYVGDGQVELAVAGEVPGHDRVRRTDPTGVGDLGLEGAVAVAQQHRHRRRVARLATARSRWPSPVKSPATIALGRRPDRVSDRGLEGAVAVAQQHRDGRWIASRWRRPGRAGRRR